jgi:Holliday junction resolvase RusA-like endonuclease
LPPTSDRLDKLVRAVGDALAIAGVYTDDSRITRISARKLYAQGVEPGASITVKTID